MDIMLSLHSSIEEKNDSYLFSIYIKIYAIKLNACYVKVIVLLL